MRRTSSVRTALVGASFAAMATTAYAAPIALPSGASVDLKFTGVTAEDTLPPGASFGNSLGFETTYGAGYLNQVVDANNPTTTYWSSGQNNQTVSFFLYGIADRSTTGSGPFGIINGGCTAGPGCDGSIHVDFYLNSAAGPNPGFSGPTNVVKAGDRTGFSTLPGITDQGTLLMSWKLTPGAYAADPGATLFQKSDALTLPTNGVGSFLANCVAGPECAIFSGSKVFDNTNVADPLAFANFFGQFTLSTPGTGFTDNGWLGFISDPVLVGVSTPAVPEPGTLAVLGSGLLGLFGVGVLWRRRKTS